MTDRHGHELDVGDDVHYFIDAETVCFVSVLRIEGDGAYLVQPDATSPVTHLRRDVPTERVLLQDVLNRKEAAPMSSSEDVTVHGVPDEPFVVPGASLSLPLLA